MSLCAEETEEDDESDNHENDEGDGVEEVVEGDEVGGDGESAADGGGGGGSGVEESGSDGGVGGLFEVRFGGGEVVEFSDCGVTGGEGAEVCEFFGADSGGEEIGDFGGTVVHEINSIKVRNCADNGEGSVGGEFFKIVEFGLAGGVGRDDDREVGVGEVVEVDGKEIGNDGFVDGADGEFELVESARADDFAVVRLDGVGGGAWNGGLGARLENARV